MTSTTASCKFEVREGQPLPTKGPQCLAEVLGLGTLADGEPGMDPEILRRLYRHARNQDGRRSLFESDPTFVRGWVNLDSRAATEIVAAFVPLDDADNLKHARRMAQANLEAQPWNDLLGIDTPPIRCVVKIHGIKWGLRFQSGKPGLRGKEQLNEDLPQIPSDGTSTSVSVRSAVTKSDRGNAPVTPASQPDQRVTTAATRNGAQQRAAEEALRRGGLPT